MVLITAQYLWQVLFDSLEQFTDFATTLLQKAAA